ncbi:MAG: phosphoenolpyruvate-utilizing protein [Actinomycetia bacterium]|nr:phosphoenolpyruvate-utilizing protein [Actinomycetes bacterium]
MTSTPTTDPRWIPDTERDPKTPFWTRANAGEVLPDPPSPAGWDLVWDDGGTMAGWRDCAINRLGVDEDELIDDPNVSGFVGLIGGYAYLSATWIRVWAERTPGMTAADMDAAYFGDHPDVPAYAPEPWHENPRTSQVMEGWLAWVMGSLDQSELETQRLEARAARDSRPDLTALSDAELLDRCDEMRPMCRSMFDMHINQSGAASIGPGAVAGICAAVGRPEAAMRILAGLGGVDSAAPSYAMWDLSRQVRADADLASRFDGGPGIHARLLAAGGSAEPFLAGYAEFLAEFGSRGPNEWDILADTWETNPDLALAFIDLMRQQPDDQNPSAENAARQAERLQLTDEIAGMLEADAEAHATFLAAVASAGTFVPGRERSKTNIIRVINESRMALRELGRRAVDGGQLDDPRDACMLFADELRALAAGNLADARETVAQRQRQYEDLQALEPPFIINGEPPPQSEWARKGDRTVVELVAGETLQGVPGCPGTYRGRARVVLDPSDPFALEPGDVLIAPHTDPAWTPLFVPAGAVIVDVGAALSHAIIVSRELGIPCVVSATDATVCIPDGAMVEVNGDTGQVTLV